MEIASEALHDHGILWKERHKGEKVKQIYVLLQSH